MGRYNANTIRVSRKLKINYNIWTIRKFAALGNLHWKQVGGVEETTTEDDH